MKKVEVKADVLTPEQAQRLLRANQVNMVKRLRDGQTLTRTQLSQIQRIADGAQAFAKTQVELAKILGVSRKTIQRWMDVSGNPGARSDGRLPVNEWKEFARMQGNTQDEDLPNQTSLKAQQILLQNAKLEHELAILRKEFVSVQQVEAWGGEAGVAIKKVVTQLRKLAPQLAGLSVPEIESRLRESETEIMSQLHSLHTHIKEAKEAQG